MNERKWNKRQLKEREGDGLEERKIKEKGFKESVYWEEKLNVWRLIEKGEWKEEEEIWRKQSNL